MLGLGGGGVLNLIYIFFKCNVVLGDEEGDGVLFYFYFF